MTLVDQYGPIVLFLSLTLETLGLPVPGESALILSSAIAGTGQISIWQVVIAAWLGAVLGDNIGYFLGRRYGRQVLLTYGARFGITESRFAKVEAITARYGPLMVIVARFVVLLRQLNGLVAGSARMHWLTFLLSNMLGAALWVGFWAILAYRLGQSVTILPYIGRHIGVLVAIVVPLLIGALIFGYLRLRRRRTSDMPSDP